MIFVVTFVLQTLADHVDEGDIKKGSLYPPLRMIRECSVKIATRIAQYAYEKGTVHYYSVLYNFFFIGCVRACVCVFGRARGCVCLHACMRTHNHVCMEKYIVQNLTLCSWLSSNPLD
jgi:hypothetical protein